MFNYIIDTAEKAKLEKPKLFTWTWFMVILSCLIPFTWTAREAIIYNVSSGITVLQMFFLTKVLDWISAKFPWLVTGVAATWEFTWNVIQAAIYVIFNA